jgi:hypothetical protein
MGAPDGFFQNANRSDPDAVIDIQSLAVAGSGRTPSGDPSILPRRGQDGWVHLSFSIEP